MNEQDHLTQQITAALETRPSVQVPEDFAARLMARIPAQPKRKLTVPPIRVPSHYGLIALTAAMVLVLAGTIAVAPLTRGSGLWLGLQLLLLAQLGTLAVLFGLSRRRTF